MLLLFFSLETVCSLEPTLSFPVLFPFAFPFPLLCLCFLVFFLSFSLLFSLPFSLSFFLSLLFPFLLPLPLSPLPSLVLSLLSHSLPLEPFLPLEPAPFFLLALLAQFFLPGDALRRPVSGVVIICLGPPNLLLHGSVLANLLAPLEPHLRIDGVQGYQGSDKVVTDMVPETGSFYGATNDHSCLFRSHTQ